MKKNPDNLRSQAQTGFSLVDIMVGMVIALLGIIIIFQVFSVSEGIKRTTTNGGDALQNGASALYALERSFKMAGYGLFASTNLPPFPADPFGTAPVTITAGAANSSDTVILNYRQGWDFGPFPPDPAVFPAAIPPALTTETITVQTNCNGNGSTLLQLCSSINGVISDGIALMKAEYGMDTTTPPDGVIDSWTQVTPTAANVMNVVAVRLALVARSAQPEKPSVLGNPCDATTTALPSYPSWIDSATVPLLLTGQADLLAARDDWQCYRYKTFENTVSLRNVIWRP